MKMERRKHYRVYVCNTTANTNSEVKNPVKPQSQTNDISKKGGKCIENDR